MHKLFGVHAGKTGILETDEPGNLKNGKICCSCGCQKIWKFGGSARGFAQVFYSSPKAPVAWVPPRLLRYRETAKGFLRSASMLGGEFETKLE